MRTVVLAAPNELELNWTWLPTFIGMDSAVKDELRAVVAQFIGQPLTEEVVDKVDRAIRLSLCTRYRHVKGLDRVLDALKFVELKQ